MKKFAGLTFFGLVCAMSSFGGQFTTTFFDCGTVSSNQPPGGPNVVTCAATTAAQLAAWGGIDIASYQLIINGGYDGGVINQTNGISESVVATSGAPSGTVYNPNAAWNFSASAFNTTISTTGSNAFAGGAPILANGFAPQATIGPLVFTSTNSLTQGSVKDITTDVFIAFTYDTAPTTSGTPEPVSMLLFGSGLLAVSVIGRKKFARK